MRDVPRKVLFVCAGACLAALLVFALRALTYGLDDIGVMYAFDGDEAYMVEHVLRNVSLGDLDPRDAYNFGYVYQTCAASIAWTARSFGAVIDVRFLGTVLRLLSVVSTVGVGAVLWRIMGAIGARKEARLLAVLALVGVPGFYKWTHLIHPDLMQSALILAGLWIAVSGRTWAHAAMAAFVAGLAFGTKYGGAFLLPACLIPWALGKWSSGELVTRRALPKICGVVAVCAACFALAYAATNPYGVANYRDMLRHLKFEKHQLEHGYPEPLPANPLLWAPILGDGVGLFLGVPLVAGLALFAGRFRRAVATDGARGWAETCWRETTLVAYAAALLGYVIVRVRARDFHYALPALPVVVACAFAGWSDAMDRWTPKRAFVAAAALLASLLPNVFLSLRDAHAAAAKTDSPVLRVAEFLSKRFPPDVLLLTELYVYVPPTFTNVNRDVAFIDTRHVLRIRPDVVIKTRGMIGRYAWKAPGTKFVDRRLVRTSDSSPMAAGQEKFLNAMLAPGSGWTAEYEDDEALVLVRSGYPR